MPMNVALHATGLSAWTDADAIQIFSPDASGLFSSAFLPWAGGAPMVGDTMLTAALVDWTGAGMPLYAATDALYLTQLHGAMTGAGAPYAILSAATSGTAPAMVDGTDAAIPTTGSIALATPATTISASLDFRATAYEALRSQVSPSAIAAAPGTNGVTVDVERLLSTHGLYGPTPDVFVYTVTTGAGAPDASFTSLSIPTPFPSTWEAFVGVTWFDRVPYMLPGATPTRIRALNASLVPLASVSGPLTPVLSPPRSLRVGALDASMDQTGVSASPTLSWSPGTTGTPTYYVVHLYSLAATGGATHATEGPSFVTTHTSLRVPSGVLMAGAPFVFAVEAMSGAADPTQHPFRRMLPEHHATALSSILTP